MKYRRLSATLLAMTAATIALHTSGARGYGGLMGYQLTKDEVALLPGFCADTQAIQQRHGSSAMHREWINRVGDEFRHMHHYCIAVIALLRSYRHNNTRTDRVGYLDFAVGNLTYVVERSRPEFVFLPEVLYRRGQAFARLGNWKAAISDLSEVLRINPGFSRAADELARAFAATGARERAIEVIEEALRHSPDSTLLKKTKKHLQSK